MRISKRARFLKALSIPLLFCAVAFGLVTVQTLIQRQAERASAASAQPLPSPAQQNGKAADPLASVIDLSEAAGQGDVAARLEMGRRFVRGYGVEKSDSIALSYFRGIISEYENISAHDKRSPYVAGAFLEMARLYKNGVPESGIGPNREQAFGFLHHAASYFGDPVAQFELAKILLSGDGVTKNARVAAQWLLSASRKGYAPAQALLGDILWRGEPGVKRVAGDGLGLLAIARRHAAGEDKGWIGELFEAARSKAQPIDILEANAFVVQELNTSHAVVTSDLLISGQSSDQPEAAANAATPAPDTFGVIAGAAISGTSKALSELGATPMGLPQSIGAPEQSVNAKDGAPSPGFIQMYKPQGRLEPLAARFAGVPG